MMSLTAAASPDSSGSGKPSPAAAAPSRYESQKRRDWNTFGQYLKNHRPPLELSRCSGAHVLEFLRYLDQFGKTKVHTCGCPFYGHPHPPAPCPCPLRQAWGSLDALIGRLRAAFEENGGQPEANPFGARAVRLYLREVRDVQGKARGIAYEKKKRKRAPPPPQKVQQPSAAQQQQEGEKLPVLLHQLPHQHQQQHQQGLVLIGGGGQVGASAAALMGGGVVVEDLNAVGSSSVYYPHHQMMGLHGHVFIGGAPGDGGGDAGTAGALMPLSVHY